ncbi:hypothetical protein [Acinetobacter dispersus]|uniref:Uncharacterized protein n=1 Tax=Acinetobacter dispersus TaxID=70348 RepID=N9MVN7_9GAMM|nr:hypothetical protein [Acinetobacter dispersus]ENW97365.1 hypothetical protein F904_00203 [Acinetobacter dispersus]
MINLNAPAGIQNLKAIIQEFDSCLYVERDNFFDKHYTLAQSEADIEKLRAALKAAELRKGVQVKVDFSHVPDKGMRRIKFKGTGIVDRCEDGRVFGRLEGGRPFCCFVTDVEILDADTTAGRPKGFTEMMRLRSAYVQGFRTPETIQANKQYTQIRRKGLLSQVKTLAAYKMGDKA